MGFIRMIVDAKALQCDQCALYFASKPQASKHPAISNSGNYLLSMAEMKGWDTDHGKSICTECQPKDAESKITDHIDNQYEPMPPPGAMQCVTCGVKTWPIGPCGQCLQCSGESK